jgi:periplasmic protein TonB
MTFAERSKAPHSVGWLTSLCLHAMLALMALMVGHHLALAPQAPPFTWHVAMVGAPSEPLESSWSSSMSVPAPGHTSTPRAPSFKSSPRARSTSTVPTGHPVAPTANEPVVDENPAANVSQHSTSAEGTEPLSADELQTSPEPSPGSLSSLPNEQAEPPRESAPVLRQAELLARQEPGMAAERSVMTSVASSMPRDDYAWLSDAIMRRMEAIKRYPAEARLERVEGKVVLKAIVTREGNVEAVEVFRSSGHQSLDRAAVELLRLAGPFHFPHSLDKPHMTVKIPMDYRLER